MAIMNLDLNLSEESRELLDKLPIDEVVMHYAETAKNAGLDQIWFCTSGSVPADLPFKPTYTITQLTELKNIL